MLFLFCFVLFCFWIASFLACEEAGSLGWVKWVAFPYAARRIKMEALMSSECAFLLQLRTEIFMG